MGSWNVLYKPYSAANSANPGGTSFLLPVGGDYQNVQIFGPNGELQDTFKRSNYGQENGVKFYSSKTGSSYAPNSQVRVTLGDGTTKNFNVGNTGGRYEGDFSSGSFNQVADPYAGGNGGGTPNFTPGQAGYGYYPGYLGNNYPSPFLSSYNAIDSAKYKYTDPLEFAKNYGEFNRGEVNKNYDQASQIALKTLDTELQGLQNFSPAAGALKRSETSIDNQFNQAERTRQLDAAMPGVRGQLQSQSSRAEAYANGRAPDGVTDAALELGIRSDAADTASAGGFGSRSSTARNLANSMSADKRIQLSQYGDQLLSSNINQRQSVEMAPTEYSDAGSQIRTTPSVSASQLTQQNLSDLNNLTTMSTSTAFQGEVQQQQYQTSLNQSTSQFNASNQLQNSQFNAGVQNTNSAGLFDYQAGYAGSVASAYQTDLNTQTALQQQQQYQQIFSDYQQQAQDAGTTQSVAQGVSAVSGAVGGGVAAINSISSALGYGNIFTSDNTAGVTTASSTGGGGSSGSSSTGGSYSVGSTSTGGVADSSYDTQEGYLGSSAGSLIANNTPTTNFASVSDVPEGYVAVTSNADGTIGAVQQSALDTSANNFYSAMGISSSDLSSSSTTAASLAAVGGAVLQNAGVYASAGEGRVSIGTNTQGKTVYGDQAMMQNADSGVGQSFINTLTGVIDPFGALTSEDNGTLRAMGSVASDVNFLGQLTALQQSGDTKGFVNAAITRLGGSAVKNASSDPATQDTLGTGFAAYQLYQNWDRMSPAQKSIGLATLGIQGYKTATGENLAQKAIIAADPVAGTPGLTVGDSLAMFGQGYNAYAVAKNWGQLNNFQKVTQGGGTAIQVAATAQQYGLLGAGTTGAAVPGVTAQGLAAAGWSTSPSLGVGAVTGAVDAAVPAGYTAVASSGGQVIAMPTSLVGTSAVGSTTGVATGTAATAGTEAAGSTAAAGASTLGTTLAVAGGALGVAGGAYAVYQGWGQGGKEGALNGAIGGTAMAAGASAMLAAAGLALGPIGWAAIIGTSILGNAIQTRTGKSGDQQDRDTARRGFKENGSTNPEDNWNVSLADGTKVDVGIDGHDGYHEARDYNVVKNDGKPLNAWDIDYSNDLDFVSGMGGMALSRIVNGGVSQGIDQFGGQLGNAALGNIGYGKDMTQTNFNKMAENQRAIYAQKGIKTKSDAFALANQAFADGRIDETQMISAHQSFNMIFDNDYKTATALMSGRNQGVGLMQNSGLIGNASSDAVQAVATKPAVQSTTSTGFQTQVRTPSDFASAQNPTYRTTGYGSSSSSSSKVSSSNVRKNIDPGFSSKSIVSPGFKKTKSYSYGNNASEYGITPTLSREAMIARNQARYQQAA